MIAAILFFMVICSGCMAACNLLRRRFEEVLPIGVGGIPVLMFFLGLLFGLKPAFYIVLAICKFQ